MAKQWTFEIHPGFNHSLRHVVADKDRYSLGLAIRDRLERVDDPTAGAKQVPNRNRYEIELMGYVITFEVRERIRLLPITKANSSDNMKESQ